MAIPTAQKDLSSRSLSDLVLSLNFINPPSDVPTRAYFSGIPVTQYSATVVNAFVNQINLWGECLSPLDKTLSIAVTLEPLDSEIFSHGSGLRIRRIVLRHYSRLSSSTRGRTPPSTIPSPMFCETSRTQFAGRRWRTGRICRTRQCM